MGEVLLGRGPVETVQAWHWSSLSCIAFHSFRYALNLRLRSLSTRVGMGLEGLGIGLRRKVGLRCTSRTVLKSSASVRGYFGQVEP